MVVLHVRRLAWRGTVTGFHPLQTLATDDKMRADETGWDERLKKVARAKPGSRKA
jgi:hypothetical protein